MLLPALINAQSTISGTVSNSNGETLKFVQVIIKSEDSDRLIGYTFTNDVGEYNIEIPNNTNLLITFSSTYHFSKTYPINTRSVQDTYTLNAILQIKPEKLEPVILDYSDSNIVQTRKDTLVFDVNAFKKGDEKVVEDLIKNIPGVAVDTDGRISFQGKSIEKLMVEGDDLFGKGYTVLSKNMPSYPIKKLEVYKNYSNNPMLTGIEDSDKVAMNLKLDEKYRNIWFGNIDVSSDLGIESKYYFKGVVSLFSDKSKHFFITHLNSIGVNGVGNIKGLLSDYDNNAIPLIGLVRQSPKIGRTDYEFNNQEVVSLSSINHLSSKIKLGTLFYAEWDENDFFQNTLTNYNLRNINLSFATTEKYSLRNKIKSGYGQLKLEYDISESQRLEAISYYSNSKYRAVANLIFNENERTERLESNYSQFKLTVDYTKKFDKSKAIVVKSDVLIDQLPQEYKTNGFFFSDFFQLDQVISQTTQSNQTNMLFSDLDINFLNRKSSGNLWNFSAGANYKRDRITSDVLLTSSEPISYGVDDLENNTEYATQNIYLKGKYLYSMGKRASIQGILELHRVKNTLNSMGSTKPSQNITYLNPALKLNWELLDYNQISLLYGYYANALDATYLIDNYYLVGYNSLKRGSTKLPTQLRNSLVVLNYELGLWRNTISFTSNLSYIKNYDYISTNTSLFTDHTVSEALLVQDQTLFSSSFELDYYLYGPKLNVKLKFGQRKINYERSLFGAEPRQVVILSTSYGIELRKSFEGNYVLLGTEWFHTDYDIGNRYSQFVNSSFFDLFVKLDDKLYTKITSDFNFIEGQENSNYLLRSETTYQIKETKLSLSLVIRNLFDVPNYTTFDLSDVGTTLTQIKLLPRIILLGLEYRL